VTLFLGADLTRSEHTRRRGWSLCPSGGCHTPIGPSNAGSIAASGSRSLNDTLSSRNAKYQEYHRIFHSILMFISSSHPCALLGSAGLLLGLRTPGRRAGVSLRARFRRSHLGDRLRGPGDRHPRATARTSFPHHETCRARLRLDPRGVSVRLARLMKSDEPLGRRQEQFESPRLRARLSQARRDLTLLRRRRYDGRRAGRSYRGPPVLPSTPGGLRLWPMRPDPDRQRFGVTSASSARALLAGGDWWNRSCGSPSTASGAKCPGR
jgi:hypothetical protein